MLSVYRLHIQRDHMEMFSACCLHMWRDHMEMISPLCLHIQKDHSGSSLLHNYCAHLKRRGKACMCVCAFLHMHECTGRAVVDVKCLLLSLSISVFQKTCLSLDLQLTDWLGRLATSSSDPPVFAFPALGLQVQIAAPGFYVGSVDPNSGSHTADLLLKYVKNRQQTHKEFFTPPTLTVYRILI